MAARRVQPTPHTLWTLQANDGAGAHSDHDEHAESDEGGIDIEAELGVELHSHSDDDEEEEEGRGGDDDEAKSSGARRSAALWLLSS